MSDELEKAIAAAKPAPCGIHCTVCEGEDHHWMPDCDEETGEPLMVCKHCDATTDYFDEIEEEVPCSKCGGSGFSGRGTGYDDVCGECGGLRYLPARS